MADIKRYLAFTLVLGVIWLVAIVGVNLFSKPPVNDKGYVEILMPGNTLVVGQYDDVHIISQGWMKIHVNRKWYIVDQYRVVLVEE